MKSQSAQVIIKLHVTILYIHLYFLFIHSFTVTYTVKYELKTHPEYVWNEYDECYNLKTGRRIRQISKKGMIGYCIKGKFKSLKSLKSLLRKPKSQNIHFKQESLPIMRGFSYTLLFLPLRLNTPLIFSTSRFAFFFHAGIKNGFGLVPFLAIDRPIKKATDLIFLGSVSIPFFLTQVSKGAKGGNPPAFLPNST